MRGPHNVSDTISCAERSASPRNMPLTYYGGLRLPRRDKLRSTRHTLPGMARTAALSRLSKPKPLCWVSVWFFSAHKSKIAPQRSGCDFGRMRKGADGVFATGGNGVERTLRRRGAWTLPLTLLHQARACPFKSARLLYLIPTMKLSLTNCTICSTFPFVCPRYGRHRMGLNP